VISVRNLKKVYLKQFTISPENKLKSLNNALEYKKCNIARIANPEKASKIKT